MSKRWHVHGPPCGVHDPKSADELMQPSCRASRGVRVGGVKTLVVIQQSLSPDLSMLDDILAIIILICKSTIRLLRLLETNKELIKL